jgi:hypothetical protein
VSATSPPPGRERVGAWIGIALLALMAGLLVLTLVELIERGAPWSQHGYPTTTTSRAGAAAPRDSLVAPGPLR